MVRACCAALLLIASCEAYAPAAVHRPLPTRAVGPTLASACVVGPTLVPATARPARVSALRANAVEPPMPKGMETKLYPQRWVQLGYLAVLALLSDWVCFSVAAAPETWVQTYAQDPATLIDIFLFTNVFFCFAEPAIVRRVGLRNCIVGAAIVMSSGCALRSGIPLTGAVPSYPFVVAGTILVGAAQPFFQCTPPLLSATWFGAEERATATATAINFNQVGIATALTLP